MKNINQIFSCFVSILILLILLSARAFSADLFDQNNFQSFIEDNKAHRIGDLITLIVVESSSAKQEKKSEKGKSVNLGGGFNRQVLDRSVVEVDRLESLSADAQYSKKGGEKDQIEGAFQAQITAQVKEIDSIGNLYVTGQKKILIEGKEQIITVAGWARPSDIDMNNTILSLRLNDAKIEYFKNDEKQKKKGLIRKIGGTFRKLW